MPKLDKFYTRPHIAMGLKRQAYALLGSDRPAYAVEPSVGSGAFVEPLESIVAFDLKTDWPGALEIDSTDPVFHDILREQMRDMGVGDMLFIGNPPFGHRGELALKFVNDLLKVGGVVAFVLPNLFRRWSVQKQIRSGARLLLDVDVPRAAFHYRDGKPYEVGCCFQVWSVRPADLKRPCSRLAGPPRNTHDDFLMRRWNRQGNIAQAFNWDWTFAVRCQGYGDYRRFLQAGSLPADKAHYIMFRPSSPAVEKRLKAIDFEALSRGQTITPGFGAADVVRAYLSAGVT
jgi:hypothetical protein